LEGFCIGVLRMSLENYKDAELRTVIYAINQYYEYEEELQRQEWERTRLQTTILVNIQLKKNDRFKVTELMPLPWDEEQEPPAAKALTYEEQKAAFEKIDALMRSRKAQK